MNNIGATGACRSRDFRELYSLYKQLHTSLSGSSGAGGPGRDETWKLLFGLGHATSANNTLTTPNAQLPYDDATLVARCCSLLRTQQRSADIAHFLRLSESLAASTSRQQYNSVLTLLLNLAEGETNATASKKPIPTIASSNTAVDDDAISDRLKLVRLARCATTPSLSSFSTAASRTNVTPSAAAAELQRTASPASWHHHPDTPLVQDVIYALGGVGGRYLRKDTISGGYKLHSKAAAEISARQAGSMLRCIEIGYYHDRIVEFVSPAGGRGPLGLMGQALCTMLQTDLTNYYGFVAMLQEEFNRQQQQQMQDAAADNTSNANESLPGCRAQPLTLLKLHMLIMKPQHRYTWLAMVADACQTKKGGELASAVAAFRSHGDPEVYKLVHEMLTAVCGPLQQMLAHWLLEGEINDPYAEFFIEALPDIGADRLWSDKYRVREAQLPSFVSAELANKVLVTGKSVNFLREVCRDRTPVAGREALLQCLVAPVDEGGGGAQNGGMLFAVVEDTHLHALIERVYLNTSKRVLDIVKGPHKLLQHLKAMRNYLLLGQGDFVGHLIENLKPELDRPARDLHQYELATILDTAIRTTNAQYDDPDIINHLEVRLMGDFDDDLGWDTFTLRYSVTGPLATMLEQSMSKYQQLFKPLWRMKHLELVLSAKVWREQVCNAKLLRSMHGELQATVKRLHLVTHQMVHFIHQMLYYILFEVIECQWTHMLDGVRQARTLDDIFEAHDRFLRQVRRDAFLENDDEIYLRMTSVFNAIGKLEKWQDQFYGDCFAELAARRQADAEVKASERRGEFGVTTERAAERERERKAFGLTVAYLHGDLDKIGDDYELCVRKFLLLLASSADANIQLFGTRLDFNEYYKKRDTQLDVPLTFAKLRQSLMYTPKNGGGNGGGIVNLARSSASFAGN